MPSPSTYDHVSPTDADHPDGVYRVVGTSGTAVTLLRVGDADGRRVHTGEVLTVPADEYERFEPAESPDRPLGTLVASKLAAGYWSVRVFARQLAAHPLPALVAVLVVLVGSFGEGTVPLPDAGFGVLILAGSLALAYVGSGRL